MPSILEQVLFISYDLTKGPVLYCVVPTQGIKRAGPWKYLQFNVSLYP